MVISGTERRAPPLRAIGIRKSYGQRKIIDGVDLEVHEGEAVALVGENGAGKTTLLRICAGLIRPDGGAVELQGHIGYCPQEPGLLDLLSADEHLVLFGRGFDLERDRAVAAGRRILERLRFPVGDATLARDLSGGSRQKLNLALALLNDPDVLLLDEPYQGFDHGTYIDFWDVVDEWRNDGRAVVIVTHMLAELTRVDRVVEVPGRRQAAVA